MPAIVAFLRKEEQTVREFRNRRSRDLPGRITEYLNLGGLWNPELMDHDEVRTMLIDARDVIEIAERERGSVSAAAASALPSIGPRLPKAEAPPLDDCTCGSDNGFMHKPGCTMGRPL